MTSDEFDAKVPSGWRQFQGKYLAYCPSAVWLVFLVLFTYKTLNEAVFKVPVTIFPGPGQIITGTTVDFYWNYVLGIHKNDQQFQLQVATDKEFTNVVETRDVTTAHARFQNAFQEKGPYFYKVRLSNDTLVFRWTSPVKFYRQDGKQEQ